MEKKSVKELKPELERTTRTLEALRGELAGLERQAEELTRNLGIVLADGNDDSELTAALAHVNARSAGVRSGILNAERRVRDLQQEISDIENAVIFGRFEANIKNAAIRMAEFRDLIGEDGLSGDLDEILALLDAEPNQSRLMGGDLYSQGDGIRFIISRAKKYLFELWRLAKDSPHIPPGKVMTKEGSKNPFKDHPDYRAGFGRVIGI